jgi:DNA (cytosine-5)-methyltransferase 1
LSIFISWQSRRPYKKENDSRNYEYMLSFKKFQPMFLYENVPGILTAGKGDLFKDVQYSLKEADNDI